MMPPDIRDEMVSLTGERGAQVRAGMTGLDGPVGVEGFLGDHLVVAMYEGAGKIAFVLHDGSEGHLSLPGDSFEYRVGAGGNPPGLVPSFAPKADGSRTVEMVKEEIRSLFALAQEISINDWRDSN